MATLTPMNSMTVERLTEIIAMIMPANFRRLQPHDHRAIAEQELNMIRASEDGAEALRALIRAMKAYP